MRFFKIFFFLSIAFSGCAQEPQFFIPQKDSFLLPLGDTVFTVHRYRYDTAAQPFFVHLHHNEQTADSAAHHILQRHGGILLTLQNNRERLISFSLAGVRYRFDPNRMFTAAGRKISLELLGKYDAAAAHSVRLFAETFLALLPQQGPSVALHNNRDGEYSIASYLPGNDFAAEAKTVFRNREMDGDDFLLTTDIALFEIFKKEKASTVLQNNQTVKDDGSLGFYLGKKSRSYTNIEAEHGHFAEQIKMITLVCSFIYLHSDKKD